MIEDEHFYRIEYGLRVKVEPSHPDDDAEVILDVVSDHPFLSIHAGDTFWPKSLIDDDPKPYMYNQALKVKDVRHAIWQHRREGTLTLHHGLEVLIEDPYKADD